MMPSRFILLSALCGLSSGAFAQAKPPPDPANEELRVLRPTPSGQVSGMEILSGASNARPIGCASTAGTYASDGTHSWQPSCLGVFLSNDSYGLRIHPTRGTDGKPPAEPRSNTYAMGLVQARMNGDDPRDQNGLFVNMDIVGGRAIKNFLPGSTGVLTSVRQRPGPNGEPPGSGWATNNDIHIAPNSGATLSFGTEIDVNNFNRSCRPGACIASHIFLNGTNAYPGTALLLAGGGTNNYVFNGTVTTLGDTVTRRSGPNFDDRISMITIANTMYRVSFVDANVLKADKPLPAHSTPVPYSASVSSVYKGIYINGYNQVQEDDILLSSSAYTGINFFGGKQRIGINMANSEITFGMLMSQGQKLCTNGTSSCISANVGAEASGITLEGGVKAQPVTSVTGLPAGTKVNLGVIGWLYAGDASEPGPGAEVRKGKSVVSRPIGCDGNQWKFFY